MSFADKILGIKIAFVLYVILRIYAEIAIKKKPKLQKVPFLDSYKKHGAFKVQVIFALCMFGSAAIYYVIYLFYKPLAFTFLIYVLMFLLVYISSSLNIITNGLDIDYSEIEKKNELEQKKTREALSSLSSPNHIPELMANEDIKKIIYDFYQEENEMWEFVELEKDFSDPNTEDNGYKFILSLLEKKLYKRDLSILENEAEFLLYHTLSYDSAHHKTEMFSDHLVNEFKKVLKKESIIL